MPFPSLAPLVFLAAIACAPAHDASAPSTPPAPVETASTTAEFTPPARGEYPDGPFGEAVRRGEALFHNTPGGAQTYMGNRLSCKNCHLDDGRQADAAPMWAAWGRYPAWRSKNQHINNMEERIQGCFTYSLDAANSKTGHAPPAGSPVLRDLEAYTFWLATGAPVGAELPGRGLPSLPPPPAGYDATRGEKVFEAVCASCHQVNGHGVTTENTVVFPPLWGPDSYNWGAGMHQIDKAAGFIWANMPLGQPRTLSHQDAWDVAAYINSKPRPSDPRESGDLEMTARTHHAHTCAYGSMQTQAPQGEPHP